MAMCVWRRDRRRYPGRFRGTLEILDGTGCDAATAKSRGMDHRKSVRKGRGVVHAEFDGPLADAFRNVSVSESGQCWRARRATVTLPPARRPPCSRFDTEARVANRERGHGVDLQAGTPHMDASGAAEVTVEDDDAAPRWRTPARSRARERDGWWRPWRRRTRHAGSQLVWSMRAVRTQQPSRWASTARCLRLGQGFRGADDADVDGGTK